jgi:membrane protein implicated in regulation of membrane protease activity
MNWWLWVLLGLALLGGELLTPGGFFLIFFGIAAVFVGLLALAGLVTSPWVQWLLFSGLSVVALALFRRPLLEWLRPRLAGKDVDNLTEDVAVALEPIAPGEIGRAELRGSPWQARNDGPAPIAPGQRCRVERIEGLMLHLRGSQ